MTDTALTPEDEAMEAIIAKTAEALKRPDAVPALRFLSAHAFMCGVLKMARIDEHVLHLKRSTDR